MDFSGQFITVGGVLTLAVLLIGFLVKRDLGNIDRGQTGLWSAFEKLTSKIDGLMEKLAGQDARIAVTESRLGKFDSDINSLRMDHNTLHDRITRIVNERIEAAGRRRK